MFFKFIINIIVSFCKTILKMFREISNLFISLVLTWWTSCCLYSRHVLVEVVVRVESSLSEPCVMQLLFLTNSLRDILV